MRRDVRELLALLAAGLVLGLVHLALRPDLPWVPAPRVEETMCGEAELPLEQPAASEAPAASFAPATPMSSPGPEDVR
ncbi:hypothetical protein [Nannocystis punicea]|uniref:Uncharacterized protein n=1 Tax=Nannocystis punicea TaxID=2995304 RepID=A0ABY7HAM3_9BACT|nr:hypothetical protein [Nannocystis poenicansa]WAS96293.1 hypothetical protein O0S08_09035 [Nannocystis poenicansa]